ncbi:MAG: TRAP transporter substrate-binding protein [Deltaproteobacteria bacterium]|nr:TRAP transporter substrate-binding protein [Deltaproteobacteria bacterium]MBW2078763.1 TRAP transporter substrate-binding protein [Deltaproteobacteria bacterium]
MHVRKRLFFVIAIIVGIAFATGGLATSTNAARIGVNCTMKPGGAEEAAIKKFREVVEDQSNGELKVDMFMAGQLGGEKKVLELLKIGQTEMSLTGGLYRGDYAKKYDPITIPFLFPTWESIEKFLSGPYGKKIKELALEKGGLIDFGPQKRAPRHMTANRKIITPSDMKGMKMRLPAVPIWVDVWKELGALPVVVPAPEIYLAMKTGKVESHENTLVSPYSRKLYEVQEYLIMTGHVYFPWEWVASEKWWNKLSTQHQAIIRDAVEVARKYGSKVEDEKDTFYLIELQKKGMQVVVPDKKAFREEAKPAIERAVNNLAPGVYKAVLETY